MARESGEQICDTDGREVDPYITTRTTSQLAVLELDSPAILLRTNAPERDAARLLRRYPLAKLSHARLWAVAS